MKYNLIVSGLQLAYFPVIDCWAESIVKLASSIHSMDMNHAKLSGDTLFKQEG
jgi:hypothetical protein